MKRIFFSLAGSLLLGACTTMSPDHGLADLSQQTKIRIGKELAWSRTTTEDAVIAQRIQQMLAQAVSVDDAIQIALFNNKALQANLLALGIAEAVWIQAGRLPNPSLSFERVGQGNALKTSQELGLNLLALLTLPQQRAIAQEHTQQIRQETLIGVLRQASATRRAYYDVIASNETVRYLQQIKQLADASRKLAQGMQQAGNWSALAAAQEQRFYTDAYTQLARAEQSQLHANEKLIRTLGLNKQQATQLFAQLPERLPDLPASLIALPDIEQQALAQRLDIEAKRLELAALARSLRLTRQTRLINVFELDVVREREAGSEPAQRGYGLRIELPLFDWGDARVAYAETRYLQALNRVTAHVINAHSEIREAYAQYQKSHEVARHVRTETLGIYQTILNERQLRYNGNLISTFDLLADAREQIASMQTYIEVLHDFWLAHDAFEMAMVTSPQAE